MPLVYVVNEPLHRNRETGAYERTVDISPALEFGQFKHILPAGRPPSEPTTMTEAIREGLKGFTSDDYLLLVGNLQAIGIATAIAADMVDGHLKLLIWHAQVQKYEVVKLDLYQDQEDSAPSELEVRSAF